MASFYGKYISGKYTHTLFGFLKDARRVGPAKALELWRIESHIMKG